MSSPSPSTHCPVYLDLIDYYPTVDNFITIPYGNITKAFQSPVSVNITSIDGYDWTKPYPGVAIPSNQDDLNNTHGIHLTVALDVPIAEDVAQNATTALSSLTFSLPDKVSKESIDDSWFICRHFYVTDKAAAQNSVAAGKGCAGFMPEQCLKDLETTLTHDWGQASNETMCAQLTLDVVPESCLDSFGPSRSEVYGFNSTSLKDPRQKIVITDPRQYDANWRMGTGYHHPHDPVAHELARNRTYLVGTVWGYNRGLKGGQDTTPKVSLDCVSAWSSKGTSSGGDTSTSRTSSSTLVGSKTSSASSDASDASTSSLGSTSSASSDASDASTSSLGSTSSASSDASDASTSSLGSTSSASSTASSISTTVSVPTTSSTGFASQTMDSGAFNPRFFWGL